MKITKVSAREILDSRGNPTVEATVHAGTEVPGYGKTKYYTTDPKMIPSAGKITVSGTAAAPSGASKGIHEAVELRDGGERFGGKGVLKAVRNVEVISGGLAGMGIADQKAIDGKMIELDGTNDKSKLGANAIVAVSMAAMRAAAAAEGKPVYAMMGGKVMPVPMLNIINGGQHAGNDLAIQEFMIIPAGAPSFAEGLRYAAETYHVLKGRLKDKYGKSATNVGDEGGFAPPMKTTEEALDAIVDSIEEAGYAKEMVLAMDAAASSFYSKEKYSIDGKELTSGELQDHYAGLLGKYPLASIEDPFQEEDFSSFAAFNAKFGKEVQVVGDDLLVTNPKRIKRCIEEKAANALLLKINQVGTVTEALEAARMARKAKMRIVVSHRSGETCDPFIADFAVGMEAGQIKAGAPARGERNAKYNRLLEIEEEAGAEYPEVFG